MTDKLTIAQIEAWRNLPISDEEVDINARAFYFSGLLLEVMRENEILKQLLDSQALASHPVFSNKYTPPEGIAALVEENPYKQSVPCGTCGKPMEDRGAANQWCKECIDNRYRYQPRIILK